MYEVKYVRAEQLAAKWAIAYSDDGTVAYLLLREDVVCPAVLSAAWNTWEALRARQAS